MADDNTHVDTAPYRYDGGVFFRMSTKSGIVMVRVTDAALDDCEPSSKARPDRLAVFQRNRYAVESVARRKVVQSKRERDGSILVNTSDLNG